MKISNPSSTYINQAYTNPANTSANQNPKSQKTADEAASDTLDSINFSGRTKDLQKISKAMETDPADREKYVADIKEKVATDQYTVNAETVAEKILGSHMNQFG